MIIEFGANGGLSYGYCLNKVRGVENASLTPQSGLDNYSSNNTQTWHGGIPLKSCFDAMPANPYLGAKKKIIPCRFLCRKVWLFNRDYVNVDSITVIMERSKIRQLCGFINPII